jgi:hypothetical protein
MKMSKEPHTIIFEARSFFRFERKHVVRENNLSFSDSTVEN